MSEGMGISMRVSGVWFALLAAALFGVSTPMAKGLLSAASPQLLAGLLYLGSGGRAIQGSA
jgi:drug/metabolite transporter (DMT)-like permease